MPEVSDTQKLQNNDDASNDSQKYSNAGEYSSHPLKISPYVLASPTRFGDIASVARCKRTTACISFGENISLVDWFHG